MSSRPTYREQLLHPNWQRKRLEVLAAADWQCQGCGDRNTTLHVHHKRYVRRRMAWEYEADELTVLCEPCHEAEHVSPVPRRPALMPLTGARLDLQTVQNELEALASLPGLSETAKERWRYLIGTQCALKERLANQPAST